LKSAETAGIFWDSKKQSEALMSPLHRFPRVIPFSGNIFLLELKGA
jgi:hypothetical protein